MDCVFLFQFNQCFEEASQFYCREGISIARGQLLITLSLHKRFFPQGKVVHRKWQPVAQACKGKIRKAKHKIRFNQQRTLKTTKKSLLKYISRKRNTKVAAGQPLNGKRKPSLKVSTIIRELTQLVPEAKGYYLNFE